MQHIKLWLLLVLTVSCHCEIKSVEELYKILEKQQQKINNLEERLYQNYKETKTLKQYEKQHENLQKEIELLVSGDLESHYKAKKEKEEISSRRISKTKRLLVGDQSHLQFEIDQLKSSIANIGASNGGAVYVIWGSPTCPGNGTEQVYSGFAGGSYYSHSGAAADYVCLPDDPIFGIQIPLQDLYAGFMYGAEYKTSYFGPAANQDVPCAVCRSTIGSSTIMIPARDQCYSGWRKEYSGHLATGRYDHPAASQFICVDIQPDVILGGTIDDSGKLLFPVLAKCGSLRCPPYKDGKELSCVVCTK